MTGRCPRLLAFVVASSAVGWLLMDAAPAAASSQVARFALVVGANRGVEPERTLRYAERDAARFAALLEGLGGFQHENVRLLQHPSPGEFLRALSELNDKIRRTVPAHAPKALALVYFSGHADGVHLELGSRRLNFAVLRTELEKLSADVKLLFVDSCQSGGLTSYQGGKPGPSFELVLDDAIQANGTAILTSSAAGEKSQESGALGGSFFTHFLISGLRGTADYDQDQKVTLSEVYRYTYSKTVAETARTMGGTQHPTYDYRISGRGKVVLTDLTRGETQLQFGPETSGTFFVFRRDTEEIVAEVNKTKGTWRSVAIPEDRYLIALRLGGRMLSKEVNLTRGQHVRFDVSSMQEEQHLARVLEKGEMSRERVLGLTAYYGLMSGTLKHYAAVHQGIVGLRLDVGPLSLFPRVGVGGTHVSEEALQYAILLVSGEGTITWRFAYAALDLFAGLGVSVGYGRQQVTGERVHTGTIFSYFGTGGVEVPFRGGMALSLFWDVGSQVFRAEGRLGQHLLLRCALGIGYHFR